MTPAQRVSKLLALPPPECSGLFSRKCQHAGDDNSSLCRREGRPAVVVNRANVARATRPGPSRWLSRRVVAASMSGQAAKESSRSSTQSSRPESQGSVESEFSASVSNNCPGRSSRCGVLLSAPGEITRKTCDWILSACLRGGDSSASTPHGLRGQEVRPMPTASDVRRLRGESYKLLEESFQSADGGLTRANRW